MPLKPKARDSYLLGAYRGYEQWGATAKMEALMMKHPERGAWKEMRSSSTSGGPHFTVELIHSSSFRAVNGNDCNRSNNNASRSRLPDKRNDQCTNCG